MYSQDDIESAIQAGVLTPQTAQALREHIELLHPPAEDDEPLRLIIGFNDVFVVIACALLLIAMYQLGTALSPIIALAAVAGASWGLGECFVRRRRMALPAIVLSVTFLYAIGALSEPLLGGLVLNTIYPDANMEIHDVVVGSGIAVGSVLATRGHWLRFRTPISIAVGTSGLVGGGLLALFNLLPRLKDHWLVCLFAAGCAVFALAMFWDARDIQRRRYQSDVAFWLHLLAAPLLVHPVFSALGLVSPQGVSLGQMLAVMVLYLVIALCSLAIDRRALMVSALGYVLYAASDLVSQSRLVSNGFTLTALVISITLLTLSVFWHPCRGAVLRRLPGRLIRHLPAWAPSKR